MQKMSIERIRNWQNRAHDLDHIKSMENSILHAPAAQTPPEMYLTELEQNNIRDTWEGKEDNISPNDNLKLKVWDVEKKKNN